MRTVGGGAQSKGKVKVGIGTEKLGRMTAVGKRFHVKHATRIRDVGL